MLAAAELYSSGNPIFSASALYRQMGNRSRYDSNAKRKITDSLEKLSTTRITISNEKEARLYNYLFRHRRYLPQSERHRGHSQRAAGGSSV